MTAQPAGGRRRGPRRAQRAATAPVGTPVTGAEPAEAAAAPGRGADDTDVGWGAAGGLSDSDDERYLRERPPHW